MRPYYTLRASRHRSLRLRVHGLANPLPLGSLALDEPSPIAGPTGSLNRERGMIGRISVALSHDLCAAECAAHRNQLITLVQFKHTLHSLALDCWTVIKISGPSRHSALTIRLILGVAYSVIQASGGMLHE